VATLLIDLALILDWERCMITVSPRDATSKAWLEAGGEIHLTMPLQRVRRGWVHRGVSKRDLPFIAQHLEREVNAERVDYENRVRTAFVRFGVRACEYRPVVVEEQLVEITTR